MINSYILYEDKIFILWVDPTGWNSVRAYILYDVKIGFKNYPFRPVNCIPVGRLILWVPNLGSEIKVPIKIKIPIAIFTFKIFIWGLI